MGLLLLPTSKPPGLQGPLRGEGRKRVNGYISRLSKPRTAQNCGVRMKVI